MFINGLISGKLLFSALTQLTVFLGSLWLESINEISIFINSIAVNSETGVYNIESSLYSTICFTISFDDLFSTNNIFCCTTETKFSFKTSSGLGKSKSFYPYKFIEGLITYGASEFNVSHSYFPIFFF